MSINQFISPKELEGAHLHDASGAHYGGGAAPPQIQPPPPQGHGHPYASSGTTVMHSSHMAPHMSTAGLGLQQPPPPASVGMTIGLQGNVGIHGIMQQPPPPQSMQQQGGLASTMHHQVMSGMHQHPGNMHSHFGQGDAPAHAHAPFVRGASDDDFGQFEDLAASSMMAPASGQINGDMSHPYVSEGVTHIVQHNGRVTVNLGTTLTD